MLRVLAKIVEKDLVAAKWKIQEQDQILLVNELQQRRRPDPFGSGASTFVADLGYEYATGLLQASIELSGMIPEFDARLIFDKGLGDAADAGSLTPESLFNAVKNREHKFLAQPQDHLVLVSSLSVRYRKELSFKRIAGCHIGFDRGLRRDKFHEGHRRAREVAGNSVFGVLPDPTSVFGHYTTVKVFVSGRSYHEAAMKGVAALDLLRGIWNLYLNRRRVSPGDNTKRRPINRVLLGPIHSLHRPDGGLATEDLVFYEPDYVGPVKNKDLRPEWTELSRFEKTIRRSLRSNPYGEAMEEALRRYSRALDTRNWDAGFLELWSLLETLTGTGKNDTHKDTITRASFNYSVPIRRMHYLMLDNLREHRNDRVHAGQASDQEDVHLYRLKFYVEELLCRQIVNIYKFKSLRESADFMSQPADLNSLQQRQKAREQELRLMKLARRFHEGP